METSTDKTAPPQQQPEGGIRWGGVDQVPFSSVLLQSPLTSIRITEMSLKRYVSVVTLEGYVMTRQSDIPYSDVARYLYLLSGRSGYETSLVLIDPCPNFKPSLSRRKPQLYRLVNSSVQTFIGVEE